MKSKIISGVTYYPRSHKEKNQFYPVVLFTCEAMTENFFLNTPQPTRSKARTIAINYIKNIK